MSSEIPPELEAEIDACCDGFEAEWLAGRSPRLEDCLNGATAAARSHLLPELVALERHYRRDDDGARLSPAALAELHPELADEVAQAAAAADRAVESNQATSRPASDVQLASAATPTPWPDSRGLHVRCPHCSNPMEILADTDCADVTCRSCGSTFNLVTGDGPTASATTLRKIGRFELIARLGVGGFGTVWKARDTELDRLVAVKIPRRGQLSASEVDQFFREARAAAQLRHPNIVPVFEVGRAEDTVFIVSDYVRGVSLADLLTDDPQTFAEVARICAQIADGLHHAHEVGVVHRDLKPSNVMIDEQNQPLIMDFGLAKREVGEITMTVEGQILGTPGYMSPEQARGHSHWTDRRTDVYSLGAVLFRMLTGELPFRGNARMQLHHKLTDDAPDPRRLNNVVPRDLAVICRKCLERDPNHRYNTAAEVADELRRYLRGEPIRARPLSLAARTWRWARRKPAAAAACVLAAALAVGGPVLAWQQRQIAQQQRDLREKDEVRLAERERMIARQKADADQQAAVIASLNDELASLRGQRPGVTFTMPGWRRGLIEQLVDARQGAMAAVLADETVDDAAAIQAGLGLGILLMQLGRHDQARDVLAKTERRLATARADASSDAGLIGLHADCLRRLASVSQSLGNEAAAARALRRSIALYRQLATREVGSVATDLQLLEATVEATAARGGPTSAQRELLQQAPAVVSRMAEHWPTSPADFYRLACQLAKTDVLLGEQEVGVGRTD